MVQNTATPSAPSLPLALARAAEAAREGATVRVADLARNAGVSVRTLYRASARHLGGPPMTRLRRARLQQVRRRLLAPGPGETVTSAATEWGFFHLGRFSVLYRRHFGEPPSETLCRARATRAPAGSPDARPGSAPRPTTAPLLA